MSAVDDARAALGTLRSLHPTGRVAVGSQTHGGTVQYAEGCLAHGAWCLGWRRAASAIATLESFLAVVESPTVPTDEQWQYCYVEKWADGSGVYERVTFDTLEQAHDYLADNGDHVEDLNEHGTPEDGIIACVERRRVWTPGNWEPVEAGDAS